MENLTSWEPCQEFTLMLDTGFPSSYVILHLYNPVNVHIHYVAGVRLHAQHGRNVHGSYKKKSDVVAYLALEPCGWNVFGSHSI